MTLPIDTPPPLDPRYEPPMPSVWARLWRVLKALVGL
jgi:hypothetical protein